MPSLNRQQIIMTHGNDEITDNKAGVRPHALLDQECKGTQL